MKKKIDARKLECPKPVLMTKKELDQGNIKSVEVLVDNDIARENLSRLAHSMNCKFSFTREASDYKVLIEKDGEKSLDCQANEEVGIGKEYSFKDLTLGFSGDIMGSGDRELGKVLIKSYIYTVAETLPYPKTLIFFNTGVKLTCKGSDVIEDIKRLKEAGVEIISCGTCLDYLNLKDSLLLGEISNMYTIYEKLKNSKNNIIIG